MCYVQDSTLKNTTFSILSLLNCHLAQYLMTKKNSRLPTFVLKVKLEFTDGNRLKNWFQISVCQISLDGCRVKRNKSW